jgi:hypothetical protein
MNVMKVFTVARADGTLPTHVAAYRDESINAGAEDKATMAVLEALERGEIGVEDAIAQLDAAEESAS